MNNELSSDFIEAIVSYARSIGRIMRGSYQIQEIPILEDKLAAELVELSNTEAPITELVDVLYYSVCIDRQRGMISELPTYEKIDLFLSAIIPHYEYSIEEIEAAALAKYKYRANGGMKDYDHELKLMCEAIVRIRKGNKNFMHELKLMCSDIVRLREGVRS